MLPFCSFLNPLFTFGLSNLYTDTVLTDLSVVIWPRYTEWSLAFTLPLSKIISLIFCSFFAVPLRNSFHLFVYFPSKPMPKTECNIPGLVAGVLCCEWLLFPQTLTPLCMKPTSSLASLNAISLYKFMPNFLPITTSMVL